jgi:predicted metal-dependent hydrolase
MEYYHNLITEKSFEILQALKKELNFILIGGWAVYFYTGALKSKDIDLIVDFNELQKLKIKYQVLKNNRLKKYEIKIQGIDIDIYVPHFSDPGLPAENIMEYTINKEGFIVPLPEVLLILKQNAYAQRKFSIKGEKEKIDIIYLLTLDDFNFIKYREILNKFKKENLINDLKKLVLETSELKELNLNQYKFSKLKRKIVANLTF